MRDPRTRFIRDAVEDPVAERIVDGSLGEGGAVRLGDELACIVERTGQLTAR